MFVAAPTKGVLKNYVTEVRRQAAIAGRDPRKLYTYNLCTVIVDETDAKAQAKFDEIGNTPPTMARLFSCPAGAASTSANTRPPT